MKAYHFAFVDPVLHENPYNSTAGPTTIRHEPFVEAKRSIFSHGPLTEATRQAASALSFTPDAMDEIGIEIQRIVGEILFCSLRFDNIS